MKNFTLAALLGAVTFLGTTAGSWAQTAEPVVPSKATPKSPRQRAMKIKNLPSAVVAYQLDPAHNPRPISFGEANVDETQTERQGAFSLPEGITEIVSIDPQNVLLVGYTNDEAVRRVQELIAVLDQSVGPIEMEAQFVEMAKSDLKNFGVDNSDPRKNAPPINFGVVRDDFTARLNALVADGKAKILWAPRINQVSQLTTRIISTKKEIIDGEPVTVTNDYRITPTINGDGTMEFSFKITENESNEADVAGRSTIANLRAGDTIALQDVMSAQYHLGNAIALMTVETMRPTDPNRVVTVFLTPRIIRRADARQQ